jgi:hypothetical protein
MLLDAHSLPGVIPQLHSDAMAIDGFVCLSSDSSFHGIDSRNGSVLSFDFDYQELCSTNPILIIPAYIQEFALLFSNTSLAVVSRDIEQVCFWRKILSFCFTLNFVRCSRWVRNRP